MINKKEDNRKEPKAKDENLYLKQIKNSWVWGVIQ